MAAGKFGTRTEINLPESLAQYYESYLSEISIAMERWI
jgi:hypothetical protein